ncbi:MAG TPA: LuxR C-terminal-related transcriptional regulator [Ktedonobacteraceae bacterium]
MRKQRIPHVLRTIPSVEGGRLYQSEGDAIIVGTPAWYDWLEHHSSFLFADLTGVFSAHKSGSESSAQDWHATRTHMGKVFTVSLGPSHAITLSSLQAAARRLADEHAQVGSTTLSTARPAASTLPVPQTAATRGSLGSLMRAKFYRPRSGSDVIPRTRLIERLNAALDGEITLVCAPAGFGKTTLLTQWVQTLDRPNAWLSLDEHDNELPIFVHSLAAALQTAFPDAFGATAALLEAPRILPPDHIAPLLINDLADVPDDVILVLDDYHLIHHREVHTLLELLVEHLPLQVHLVLISRSNPPLPLARWLAKGRLNELRGADLRFTLEETQSFLTRLLGSEAAGETAGALDERTEGWIAVLRLAALSLRSTSDRASFLQRLDSYATRSISSYLVGEILAQQAYAVQEVLERASILEQFCAQLCAAVVGSEISPAQVQTTLDWLEQENLFLVPLDKRQGWYRLHHLFQGLLQQRLQTHCSQEELATLHHRASAWYAGQGLVEEAIEHALEAGDSSGATQLVEAHFFRAFEQEQLSQMEHWLRLLPEEQIYGSPVLLVARAWISQAHGQLQELPRLLSVAEQLVAAGDRHASDAHDPAVRLLRALMATLWSLFHYFTGQAQASLESARSALAWIPPGEEHMASHATFYLALSNQATGHEEVALVALQRTLRDQVTRPSSIARLLYAQAFVYLAMGKLLQVEHTARHLLHIAQEADLVLSQQYAHWLLGLVYYERNKLDEAAYHFSVVIANQHQAHLWVVQDALCGLALTYQAQGLSKEAQETARTLLQWVQEQHAMRELMGTFAFCGRLALLQNEVEEASQWLEMAGEQEVLGPMPFLEDPPMTEVRLLFAKGDEASVAKGQALLTQLLQHVEAIHNTRKMIQVLALQAWVYDLQGRESEALAVLERALALARPAGFLRTFADLAPLATLLNALRKDRKARHAVDKHLDAYLQGLLAAMNLVPAQAGSRGDLLEQEGLEPLTRREQQILHLLNKDLTNKEIARELVVTPGTVKLHTKHVYSKLSVNNRRAAVTLGRALGLLAAT